jgi:Lrp/AsnC family transcriptional regulator for asnA, asnC and gidA
MYKTDKTDLEIVNLLMEDGRMPSAEIARRVGGITERTVRYRINRLVEAGIIRVSAIVNSRALGYSVVADVFIEVAAGRIMEVANQLARCEQVSYVSCSIGESDVSIQVVACSNEEVYSFVTGTVGKIPGVLKTVTSIVPVTLKDVYQWHIPKSSCKEIEITR